MIYNILKFLPLNMEQNISEKMEISGEDEVKNIFDHTKIELACAPMLKVTTPPFRKFLRIICKEVILYTEMIVINTVTNVSEEKLNFLLGDPEDNTVVQLGGSDPEMCVKAVEKLLKMGYKQFNLNCGCPSDRVQKGMFGAILMKHKELVAEIVNRVYEETGVIITLKTRIGADDCDSYEFFREFIDYIYKNTKCRKFYVHARKCWLKGLSPTQNRNVPPLRYDYVYRIKEEFNDCFIGINGGIKYKNIEKTGNCDGAMIGRDAMADIETFNKILNIKTDILKSLEEYFNWAINSEYHLSKIIYPIVHLRKGKTNSKLYKLKINELIQNKIDIKEAYEQIKPFFE